MMMKIINYIAFTLGFLILIIGVIYVIKTGKEDVLAYITIIELTIYLIGSFVNWLKKKRKLF